jgi:glycosyltransferase involved in cell wall biosynthesis
VSDVAYPWIKGGSEYRIHQLAEYLALLGHEVTLLTGKWWAGPRRIGNLLGVPLIRKLYTGRRSSLSAASFALSLAWTLPSIKQEFDIIEFNMSPVTHFALLELFRRSKFGHKAILIGALHEIWQAHWFKYAGVIDGYVGYALEKYAIANLDHIITVSSYNRGKLVRAGVSPEKVTVIRPGVDFQRIDSALPSKDLASDVLFVGRLVQSKHVETLVRAIDVLNVKHAIRAKCKVVGDGPELTRLKSLADSLGVGGQIEFMGRIHDQSQVFSIMKSSKVFVSPAAPEGGWNIAFTEANAAGLPVITASRSDIGVSSEEVLDGINGFVVPELSPEDFADRIDEILSANGLRKTMSEKSKTVAKKYDWLEIAKETSKTYSALAGKP